MHTCFQLQPEGSCLFVFKSGVGVDGEVEVLVKDDVASAVAPAADIDCDADRGGMTGSILDIDAHDREFAAHALGTETDCIDAVLKELLHLRGIGVVIVGADGTHQGLLGIEGSGLDGSSDAYAHEKGRTGVQPIGCHAVEDEFCNSLIAFTGHQNSRIAGKRTAAACHIGIDLALVRVRNYIPPDCRGALANVLAGVVLIECLHGIVAQRCVKSCLYDGFLEQHFEIVNEGELCAAFYPELEDSGVLTGGAVNMVS